MTAETTIDYLQAGLKALGFTKEIYEEADNHTLRKAFAKERYRNGDSVEEIADALADTVEVVRKYYLGRDLKKMKKTVNNTPQAKQFIDVMDILDDIVEYAKIRANDKRFKKPTYALKSNKLVFELPLSALGITEMGN